MSKGTVNFWKIILTLASKKISWQQTEETQVYPPIYGED